MYCVQSRNEETRKDKISIFNEPAIFEFWHAPKMATLVRTEVCLVPPFISSPPFLLILWGRRWGGSGGKEDALFGVLGCTPCVVLIRTCQLHYGNMIPMPMMLSPFSSGPLVTTLEADERICFKLHRCILSHKSIHISGQYHHAHAQRLKDHPTESALSKL